MAREWALLRRRCYHDRRYPTVEAVLASYIIGYPEAAFVTDPGTGTISVVPGIPITEKTSARGGAASCPRHRQRQFPCARRHGV